MVVYLPKRNGTEAESNRVALPAKIGHLYDSKGGYKMIPKAPRNLIATVDNDWVHHGEEQLIRQAVVGDGPELGNVVQLLGAVNLFRH